MTLWTEAGKAAVSLMINLTIFGGLVAVCTLALLALNGARGSRLRYLVALTGFLAAATAPVAMTVDAARSTTLITGGAPLQIPAPAAAPLAYASERLTTWLTEQRKSALMAPAEWLARTVAGIWLCGVVILGLRDVVAHSRLRGRRHGWRPMPDVARLHLNWPASVPAFLSPETGPFVIGLYCPAVVLPERLLRELPADDARAVALHELSHVVWRDPLVNALVRFTCILIWPSLPLWYLARILHTEREAAADAAAVEDPRNPVRVADYAAALLTVARWSYRRDASDGPAIAFGRDRGLEERLRRLILPRSSPGIRVAGAGLSLVVAGAGLAAVPVSWELQGTARAVTLEPHGMPEGDPQAPIASRFSPVTQNSKGAARLPPSPPDFQRRAVPLEARHDVSLLVANDESAPILITQAVGKRAIRGEFLAISDKYTGSASARTHDWLRFPSDEAGITLPRITVRNRSAHTVAAFVIEFIRSPGTEPAHAGRIERTLHPGESATYATQWAGPNVFLPGSASEITVYVRGVRFTHGDQWFASSSDVATIRRPRVGP